MLSKVGILPFGICCRDDSVISSPQSALFTWLVTLTTLDALSFISICIWPFHDYSNARLMKIKVQLV